MEQRQTTPDLLVPEGTRLLHVGAQKTGTTAIQQALVAAREQLLPQGVRLLGREQGRDLSAHSVLRRTPPLAAAPPPISVWQHRVRTFDQAAEARVVMSDENFSFANRETIARIARDLDPSRLRVVITLRNLGLILPSFWQQNVQAGVVEGYDDWLRHVFERRTGKRHPFWNGERHVELVQDWVDAIGADRVIVIAVAERDRRMLYNTFEGMLGLRDGTLQEVPDRANRSLTLVEAEAVRAFNVAATAAEVSRDVHTVLMRSGAAERLKTRTPGPGEGRARTPKWALEQADGIARDMVAGIRASGAVLIGDIDGLCRPLAPDAPEDLPPADRTIAIPPDVVGALSVGIIESAGLTRQSRGIRGEPPLLQPFSTGRLLLTVARRFLAAAHLPHWPGSREQRS